MKQQNKQICIAEFHPEECATHEDVQRKSVVGIIAF